MVKRIVFHLGGPKTGSTAIQRALAAKRFICDDVTILYPTQLSHMPLAKTLYFKRFKPDMETRFKHLAAMLQKSDADVAIISAELFERVNPKRLRRAVKKYLPEYAKTARYIAYVRPHADRLVSAYAERVKQGYAKGTMADVHERMKEKNTLRYYEKFTMWRDVFGDNFELRPMIRSQLHQNCVVRDFLNYATNGADLQLTHEPESNKSLSLQDLAMLRTFHNSAADKPHLDGARRAIGWHFATMLTNAPLEAAIKPRLDKALLKDVIETYQQDAKNLDDMFFKATPMMDALNSAHEKTVDMPQSILLEDHYSETHVRSIQAYCTLVANLIEHQPDKLPALLRKAEHNRLISQPT